MTISAYVVADSVGQHAPRLTSMVVRYPLIIHAELMTHRVFSRNAASMRAIPIEKLIADIKSDPFIPEVWLKNQKGMQGYEELSQINAANARRIWLGGLDFAIGQARDLSLLNVHKQTVNRLFMPYAHITVLITSTYWKNFFVLRAHPKAEPHMQKLAEAMYNALWNSKPELMNEGEWHLPFIFMDTHPQRQVGALGTQVGVKEAIKVSVARCASTSYRTVDGFDMSPERAKAVYNRLLGDTPIHASPAEHQAQVDRARDKGRWDQEHLRGNFAKGWVQYRKTLPGEALMEDE